MSCDPGFSEELIGYVALAAIEGFKVQKLLSGSFTEVFKNLSLHGVRWEIPLRFNDSLEVRNN